jgi:hypothetical protein
VDALFVPMETYDTLRFVKCMYQELNEEVFRVQRDLNGFE